MKTWVGRLTRTVLSLAVLGGVLGASAIWYGNRDVAQPTLAQRQQSYDRAVGWLRAHEPQLMQEANSALWWMVKTAADRRGDPYLQDLVTRSSTIAYAGETATVPWKRMVYPRAEITLNQVQMEPLMAYQRFFYHAVTCQPVALDDGTDTNVFLEQNVCRPPIVRVLWRDTVCSTHQLMGVKLFQRTGCTTQADLAGLEAGLLSDIDTQMRLDVLVKDAFIQRVLTLMWVGGPDRVKPVWFQRVLAAQSADGGWAGHRQVPEFPTWLQPWYLKSVILRRTEYPGLPMDANPSDFHATAQGLLIAALSLPAAAASATASASAVTH